ncbi:hypothetical protein [Maritalea sp.]|uniref:hypothetical protein n=1 Tax=Maritalea sp. TaxID=2003361 RepID=UPI0039E55048
MTCTTLTNVPRESYHRRMGNWFKRFAIIFWPKQVPSHKVGRPPIPNDRMVALSPHLLRDIGFADTNVQRKYR